ncbi:MAG: hypothetical protein RLZZ221_189, partial [Verrucomicrobiota bacterium]
MSRPTPPPEHRKSNGRFSRRRTAKVLTLALLATGAVRVLAAEKVFTDPAPPAFEAGPVPAAAQPRENPEATAHTAPRALVPGARTSDWPNFLGPAHNLTSVETRLRRNFPAAGLTPVWEMRKGEGFASPVVAGERLVLFHRVGNEEVVDCVQAGDG